LTCRSVWTAGIVYPENMDVEVGSEDLEIKGKVSEAVVDLVPNQRKEPQV